MIIVSINSCNFGSTGNIMLNLSEMAINKGYNTYIICANSRSNKKKQMDNQILIGGIIERNIHLFLSWITGLNGYFSHFGTFFLLKRLDKLNIDIIHLHNLHNCYINLPMLFRWIKKRNVKVIWTLHDCWSFTGQCPHFTINKCYKWKTQCYNCPQYKSYPASLIDNTKIMYQNKKRWFTNVENMIIVTPSNWLANLVNQSFLSKYPVKVINNGINLNIFQPIDSDFRDKRGLINKTIILGVALTWSYNKGLDVFIELAKKLDTRYQIILVGISEDIKSTIPDNILAIERTSNQKELAEIYSAADIFLNPSREESFSLVNVEALACGTPVITFKSGGSPESIDDTCGIVIDYYGKIDTVIKAIEHTLDANISREACRKKAKVYNMNDKYLEYMQLYRQEDKNSEK